MTSRRRPAVRIPCSTYRLQFHAGFTFRDATRTVPYLHELGITDCYASPIFPAPSGSNHGYDVCDYSHVNPVLGGESSWMEFTNALASCGMGLLQDFVPNHMHASAALNPWWRQVLQRGSKAPSARYFDIDWKPEDSSLYSRILLPVLEDHYGKVLKRGIFSLELREGEFWLRYRDSLFPINAAGHIHVLERVANSLDPRSKRTVTSMLESLKRRRINPAPSALAYLKKQLMPGKLADSISARLRLVCIAAGKDAGASEWLHELLEKQFYRLGYWASATCRANYRRFFDIDSLVGVAMERPDTFRAAHRFLLREIKAGRITGIRLDHVDGMANPAEYLRTLQAAIAAKREWPLPGDGCGFYVIVEKILTGDEQIRSDWAAFGTTGYEFATAATSVLIDPSAEPAFAHIYSKFAPDQPPLNLLIKANKRKIMRCSLSREARFLTDCLIASARMDRDFRDVGCEDLENALRETAACFPVYRTYAPTSGPIQMEDRKVLGGALLEARRANPEIDSLAFDCLERLLLRNDLPHTPRMQKREIFFTRFQQFTGPVMAKGFEDTTLFNHGRLIALNDVGSSPGRFGMEPEAFHGRIISRSHTQPHGLNATSTHDTKMSEDVRARLAALSEFPRQWEEFLQCAVRENAAWKRRTSNGSAPSPAEEYMLYQYLLGSWPLHDFKTASRSAYIRRIKAQMIKALREGKVSSRWDAPNQEWEEAVGKFIDRVVSKPSRRFKKQFDSLSERVAETGAINSLSQTLLKMACPGVPDFFQGDELWRFDLTDPDNRHTVDYEERKTVLASLADAKPVELLANWRAGAIKMFLIKTMLHFRRAHPRLFSEGAYKAVLFSGAPAGHCIGLSRSVKNESLVILTPRLTSSLGFPPVGGCWSTASVKIPGRRNQSTREIFSGKDFSGRELLLREVFQHFPFAALHAAA